MLYGFKFEGFMLFFGGDLGLGFETESSLDWPVGLWGGRLY